MPRALEPGAGFARYPGARRCADELRLDIPGLAAEETNHPREVVEAALAHVIQKVEAACARSDLFERRRQLMYDWSVDVASGAGNAG